MLNHNVFVCWHCYYNKIFSIAISTVSPGLRIKSSNKIMTERFEEAASKFMDGLYGSLQEPPIWKFYRTNSYRNLESSHSIYKK